MLISKIKRTNTSVFNFAKLKNKAVSVEKKSSTCTFERKHSKKVKQQSLKFE